MNTTVNSSITHNSDNKTHAIVAYVLMATGLFTAIPILIGAVWAMFTRKNALDTVYYSHYTNAIRTFWWSLAWTIIGCLLLWAGIGFAILAGTWLWVLYRTIYGLATILDDKPYPL